MEHPNGSGVTDQTALKEQFDQGLNCLPLHFRVYASYMKLADILFRFSDFREKF